MPLKDWTPPQTNKPQLDWTMAVWWKTLVLKSKTPWKIGNRVTATGPLSEPATSPVELKAARLGSKWRGPSLKRRPIISGKKKQGLFELWPSINFCVSGSMSSQGKPLWVPSSQLLLAKTDTSCVNFLALEGLEGIYSVFALYRPLCKQIILNQAMNV